MLNSIHDKRLEKSFIETDIFDGGENQIVLFQMNNKQISIDMYPGLSIIYQNTMNGF